MAPHQVPDYGPPVRALSRPSSSEMAPHQVPDQVPPAKELCRYFAKGHCKRKNKCHFLHDKSAIDPHLDDEEETICAICYEKPEEFGLLIGCDHMFCLNCIQTWRRTTTRPEAHEEESYRAARRECPMCRSPSDRIVPSVIHATGAQKEQLIQNHTERRAKIQCKYYKGSHRSGRRCPFGDDCMFAHDGSRCGRSNVGVIGVNDPVPNSIFHPHLDDDDSDDSDEILWYPRHASEYSLLQFAGTPLDDFSAFQGDLSSFELFRDHDDPHWDDAARDTEEGSSRGNHDGLITPEMVPPRWAEAESEEWETTDASDSVTDSCSTTSSNTSDSVAGSCSTESSNDTSNSVVRSCSTESSNNTSDSVTDSCSTGSSNHTSDDTSDSATDSWDTTSCDDTSDEE
ncbi:hypothetical protein BC832DRAFT_411460 [Gaertneriomyces semiglobifer]|nr:hypothetical protein BC832DRAFT_411460 [Gaertneriomyces semiglobifer]